MGIYAQYNIFPFSPHHKKFVTPEGGLDIFSESDVSIVYKAMREKSKNFIGKQDAKKIQNSLNLALQKNFENYETMQKRPKPCIFYRKRLRTLHCGRKIFKQN